MKSLHRISVRLLSVATVVLMGGCASVPNADVQTFSNGVSAAKQQTDTAFQAVTDLTSDSIIDYAASQPTLNDASFEPVLDPQSIAVWDNVFTALEKYAQSLVLLTSPNVTTQYENAIVGLAGEVKQAGSDFQKQKLVSSAPAVPASFAAAFTELGDLLLQAKSQHDAKRIIVQADPTIRSILTTMADTIGTSTTTPGLRATVHANWEQRKGTEQVAFLNAKTPTDKRAIAVLFSNDMSQEAAQDLALSALQKSLLSLTDAHHALASNKNADLASAVASVEQAMQNTLNIANRFQSTSTSH
jgi:hypothetical protein